MRLKSLIIENFKAFKKVKIDFNENFNFIVGENNIGKSTIFEAIQLWKIGYDKIIAKTGKSFYGENTNRYLPFDKLFFLRLASINDMFFNKSKKKVIISITISHLEIDYKLNLSFEKPISIDSYFRIKSSGPFTEFKDLVLGLEMNLRTAIYLYESRPIFHSIKNEPFYNNAQLLKKISLGKSNEVLRNKILRCEDPETKFERLENRLNNIFISGIKLRSKNKNKQDDEYVRLTIEETNKNEIDISLVGSGVLQVLEIFSTLDFMNKSEHSLKLLLIDEPDSHIHSNLQCKLIDELRNEENNQIFLISHNEKLINKSGEGELFFINKINIDAGIITSLPENSYSSVVTELSGELANLTEEQQEKIIVITEGKTDKRILLTAWGKLNPDVECPFHFIPSGLNIDENTRTGNAKQVKNAIEIASTLSVKIKLVGLFDNDKAGNESYKGVNNGLFEAHQNEIFNRKHLEKDIHALLLPVPDFRGIFVTPNDINQRYFVIEHYFSDEILDENHMKGNNILDTAVFEIKGNKNAFSNSTNALNDNEFENFNLLFETINGLFPVEE